MFFKKIASGAGRRTMSASNKVEPFGATGELVLLQGKQEMVNREEAESVSAHSLHQGIVPGSPRSDGEGKAVQNRDSNISQASDGDNEVRKKSISLRGLLSRKTLGCKSVSIKRLLSSKEEKDLNSIVLKGYFPVKVTDRAVVYKIQLRLKGALRSLPQIVSSDRFIYMALQSELFKCDGRYSSLMNAMGEKLKEVEGCHTTAKKRSSVKAKERIQSLRNMMASTQNLMKISSVKLSPKFARERVVKNSVEGGDDHDEKEHMQSARNLMASDASNVMRVRSGKVSPKSIYKSVKRGGDLGEDTQQVATPITLENIEDASAVLGTEMTEQLEALTDAVEVTCRHHLEKWAKKRAPIYEKIMQHEQEQKMRAATMEDAGHAYEDLEEMEELMRIFPFRVSTAIRDKFGNFTIFVVPHLGGSKMSEIWHNTTDPERFAHLILVLNEHLAIINDVLIQTEKRFLGVNYIWDWLFTA